MSWASMPGIATCSRVHRERDPRGLGRARGRADRTAVDISRRALLATRLNGALNGVWVRTRRSDLLGGLGATRYDVIVSNPPYLPAEGDAPPRGRHRATDAGRDGRRFVDRLIAQAPRYLRPGGVLLVVHSSINGTDTSRRRLLEAGLLCDVPRRETGPLGPLLSARAPLLEQRGLLEPGRREEDIVVVRGELPAARHG